MRKISTEGIVTTVAGSGERGFADGDPLRAKFDGPAGIGVDAAGNLYVAEIGNNRIRKIVPGKRVLTYAGGDGRGFKNGSAAEARFSFPATVVTVPSGLIFRDRGHGFWRRRVRC